MREQLLDKYASPDTRPRSGLKDHRSESTFIGHDRHDMTDMHVHKDILSTSLALF